MKKRSLLGIALLVTSYFLISFVQKEKQAEYVPPLPVGAIEIAEYVPPVPVGIVFLDSKA